MAEDGKVQEEKTPEEMRRAQLQEISELHDSYKRLFESPDGQKVLADMSKRMYWRKPTIHENSNIMSFREGQRSAICHINTMMTLDVEHLEKLGST